jgi:hypothetical protein
MSWTEECEFGFVLLGFGFGWFEALSELKVWDGAYVALFDF